MLVVFWVFTGMVVIPVALIGYVTIKLLERVDKKY